MEGPWQFTTLFAQSVHWHGITLSRFGTADPRDLPDPCPFRLQAGACAVAPRGLGDQREEDLSHLQGVGHAIVEQDAEAAGKGQTPRRTEGGCRAQRYLGYALPDRRLREAQSAGRDFVHDQLSTGRKLRELTVVDTFSRYVPLLDARFTYRGKDVVATLERVCKCSGYPATTRVVQGSEFISKYMDIWA